VRVIEIAPRRQEGRILTSVVLFDPEGDQTWSPAPQARGGYDGVQGGVAAALLCAVAEQTIGQAFEPRAITAHFFRTVPLLPLRLEARRLHEGRRSAVCDVEMRHDGRLLARATVTFAGNFPVPAAPEPLLAATDPADLKLLPKFTSLHGQPWHDDVLERAERDEEVWYRSAARVTETASSFANTLPFADWSPAAARPDDWKKPAVRGLPNVEFSAHADRLPASGWIGMRPISRWWRSGSGYSSTPMSDLKGEFGRFSTTLILLPH
jgi:hypothetical protein